MTGGGFGGCAVALVAEDQVKEFQEAMIREYRKKTGLKASVYVTLPVNGTDFEAMD